MIKSLFNDNDVYGKNDINNVFTHLTSGGVVSVSESIVTATLESGVAQIANSGVEFHDSEACRVIKYRGGYIVSNGSAFMPDGSIVTVSGEGETVEGILDGSVNYVFFERSSEKNGTFVKASEQLPSDTDNTLLLAVIGADGGITDKREYATTKLMPSSGNIYIQKNVSFHYLGANGLEKHDDEGVLMAEINIGWGAYKYIKTAFTVSGVEADAKWADISQGSAEFWANYNNGCNFKFVKDGGKLKMYQIYASSNSMSGGNGSVQIEVF